jgi:hypothetical protein
MTGKFRLEYHSKWYQNRKVIETALHGNATREHTRQLPLPTFLNPRLLVTNTGERMCEVSVSNPSINEQRGSSATATATATEASEYIVVERLRPFPCDYEPHENAVLCGRGRICKEASGNLRLQSICKTFLKEYARDTGKKEKSEIVSRIMEIVRASCAPSDGFVRLHDDRWWDLDDVIVRNKVTGMLRDSLSSKYKSSTQAKVAKRRMQNVLSSVADQQVS